MTVRSLLLVFHLASPLASSLHLISEFCVCLAFVSECCFLAGDLMAKAEVSERIGVINVLEDTDTSQSL